MGKIAPVLRLAWTSAVNSTGKLAEVLLRCVEEGQESKEEVKKVFEGKALPGKEKGTVLWF